VMALAGFGCGCFPTVATKAVLHWFPLRERATAIGINQTSLNVAGVLTASALPTLALVYGWRAAFIPVALIPIAASVAAYTLYREPVGEEPPKVSGKGVASRAISGERGCRGLRSVSSGATGARGSSPPLTSTR